MLDKTYDPSGIEQRRYDEWLDNALFESHPDTREPYTVVIPPPNVTGVLHMGHCLNNTIQDILIRRARMQGFNACWVPGTDHASIATEAKVVAMLKDMGIDKKTLNREDFLKYAWEWKEKYGGIILQQLKKLGCALDWTRTSFTMDPDYYAAVIDVFIDLYKKGHIYRGVKMINWDPVAKTALSDEEVNYKEVKSKLYYVKYKLVDGDGFITVATTRPETILGDTAVCVHPNDPRYSALVGKQCFVPLINRAVPIIADEYIDIEFGTGALKVTPAHDINDYNIGIKHNLEVIDTLNDDGTMSPAAQLYVGEDRFIVRKKIAKQLEAEDLLDKVEEITNTNGFSERTDAVIEPRLSMQWWCNMTTMAKPALADVLNDDVQFYPAKFKNTYRHWMENIKDWCISRQLWWGHRIPAYYLPDGKFAVAKSADEAYATLTKQHPDSASKYSVKDLRQDEDVLDTWFSSWLWPIEVFKGITNPGNDEIKYYYPTATLVTAPEIIFFWVARMIMAGHEYEHQKPFSKVYFTGIVRDKQGRKMSKSLGNSPDLLGLIDKYGADAVRFGILITSPAGNDLLYDDKLCEQGRNFNNKLWNALRLVKGWKVEEGGAENEFAIEWFEHKLRDARKKIDEAFDQFAISEALKTVYSLIWDDFCAWYLEMVKPDFEKPIGLVTYNATIKFFEALMQQLHPFMPFITEEIYQFLRVNEEPGFLLNTKYEKAQPANENIIHQGDLLTSLVSSIRDLRVKNQIKARDPLDLVSKPNHQVDFESLKPVIQKLAFVQNLMSELPEDVNALQITLRQGQFYLLSGKKVDSSKEIERIEKDLAHAKGFLQSVMSKLTNEKFVANAKADVLERERQKASDAESKIKLLQDELSRLGVNA